MHQRIILIPIRQGRDLHNTSEFYLFISFNLANCGARRFFSNALIFSSSSFSWLNYSTYTSIWSLKQWEASSRSGSCTNARNASRISTNILFSVENHKRECIFPPVICKIAAKSSDSLLFWNMGYKAFKPILLRTPHWTSHIHSEGF